MFLGDVLIAEEAVRQRLSIASDLLGALVLGYAEVSHARRSEPVDWQFVTWHPPRAEGAH